MGKWVKVEMGSRMADRVISSFPLLKYFLTENQLTENFPIIQVKCVLKDTETRRYNGELYPETRTGVLNETVYPVVIYTMFVSEMFTNV